MFETIIEKEDKYIKLMCVDTKFIFLYKTDFKKKCLIIPNNRDVTGNCKFTSFGSSYYLVDLIKMVKEVVGEKETSNTLYKIFHKLYLGRQILYLNTIYRNNLDTILKYVDIFHIVNIPVGYSENSPQYHMFINLKYGNIYKNRKPNTINHYKVKEYMPKVDMSDYIKKDDLRKLINENYKKGSTYKNKLEEMIK